MACDLTLCYLVRISTVSGETGASDELRDPRGFSVKYAPALVLPNIEDLTT